MSASIANMRSATSSRTSASGTRGSVTSKRSTVVAKASNGPQEQESRNRAPLAAAAAAIALSLSAAPIDTILLTPPAQANEAALSQLSGAAKGAAANLKGAASGSGDQVAGAVKGAANEASGSAKGVANQVKGALKLNALPAGLDNLAGQAKGLASDVAGNAKGAVSQAKGSAKGAANNAQGSAGGAVEQVKNIFGSSSKQLPSTDDVKNVAAQKTGEAKSLGAKVQAIFTSKPVQLAMPTVLPNGGAGVANDSNVKPNGGLPLANTKGAAEIGNTLGAAKGAFNNAEGTAKGAAADVQGGARNVVDQVKGALSLNTLPSANNLAGKAQGVANEAKGNLKGAAGNVEGAAKGAANQASGTANGLANKVKGVLSLNTLPGPGGYNNSLSDNIKEKIGDVRGAIGTDPSKSSIVTDRRNEPSNPGQNLAAAAQDSPKPSVADQVKGFIKDVPISTITIPDGKNPMTQEQSNVKGFAAEAKDVIKSAAGPVPGGNPGANAGNEGAGAAKDVAASANSATQNIIDKVKTALGDTPLTTIPSNPAAAELSKVQDYAADAKNSIKNAGRNAPGGNPGVNAGNPVGLVKDVAAGANSATQNVLDSVKSLAGKTPLQSLPGPLAAIQNNDSAVNAENATKTYNPPGASANDVDYTKKVADALKQIPANTQAAAKEARNVADKALN